MGKKKGRKSAHGAPGEAGGSCIPLTANEILEEVQGYQLVKTMTRIAIIGCLISVTGALLLRMNVTGYGLVPLFLNTLSYVFAGAALFLWLARMRPLRKQAQQLASEQNAAQGLDEAVPTKHGGVEGSQEYLRYRMIWRVLLVVCAVLIISASFALSAFAEQPAIAVTLQALTIVPAAAALWLYRARLKPLKAQWQKRKS